jgi:hypothetical protein
VFEVEDTNVLTLKYLSIHYIWDKFNGKLLLWICFYSLNTNFHRFHWFTLSKTDKQDWNGKMQDSRVKHLNCYCTGCMTCLYDLSDCCLTPRGQCFSYITVRTSYISIRKSTYLSKSTLCWGHIPRLFLTASNSVNILWP